MEHKFYNFVYHIKNMNQFFKLTKTKIKITIYFIILSFLFSVLFLIINRALISNTSEEELYFLIQYVLPVPSFVLSALELYLYACLAIYFVSKEKKG